ncbi:Ig-like domain-containing protein [uncultured Thermus sp.]|uniref:Ig-like domain-containing protein n=1 Tax=uncultured Thermus sp. TaxID=157149 RepID=UPI0026130F67|nr:Ig-like domain-containing protein [uncultured Thermus sp.]
MVQVNATATGPGARVDRVEVAYTGPQNGTLPLTPRGGIWEGTLPSTLPSGVYTLTPKAWVGSVERSGDSVRFTLDRDPPSVSFVSVPTPLGQETVEVRVSVTDALSGVAEVRLFAGAKDLGAFAPLGNGVYTFSLRPEDLPQGDVNLRVVARDRAGNEASASQNVDRTAPTVVWRRPADGSQVSGTVTLEVEARDNVGVAKVEFFAGSTKLGEDGAGMVPDTYTLDWNTVPYPDGPVTLKARAVDAAGNASEATLTVTVANEPAIWWVAPVPNQRLAGFVNLQAEVRAVRTVSRVDFYFGPDLNTLAKIPGSPSVSGNVYSLGWNLLRVSPGSYILKVEVEDVAGSLATAVIPVEVASVFVITTPRDGDEVGPGAGREIVSITVGVNGTLPPGVTVNQVDVYINGVRIGSATRQSAGDDSQVFVYVWDTSVSVPGHDPTKSGDRVITAEVVYRAGSTSTSTLTGGILVHFLP